MNLPRPRKLQAKVLLRLGSVLFIGAALFGVVALMLLERKFSEYERHQLTRQLDTITTLLDAETGNLYGSAVTYGQWDDTWNFINNRDPRFTQSNFTVDALRPIFVDLIAIFDARCGVAYAGWIGKSSTTRLETPPLDLLSAVCERARARNMKHPVDSLTWWTQYKEQPLLVAASPVTDSLDQKPSNGTLVMARFMSANYVRRIQHLVGLPFHFVPLRTAAVRIEAQPRGLIGEKPVSLSPADQSFWAISSYSAERTTEQRRAGVVMVVSTALALFVLALIAVWWSLDRLILRRLVHFEELSGERRRTGQQDVRWPVEGVDEIDALGESLNELLSEASQAQKRLSHDATHDTLTGVGNRALLAERMEFISSVRERNPDLGLFLVLIDVDNFKLINDTVGHVVGDRVLVELARRLSASLRGSDTVVRLGGDEFALLGLGVNEEKYAVQVADRLRETLEHPVEVDGHTVPISVSMGLVCTGDRLSFHEWLRQADIAIFEAKQGGKGRLAVFTPELDQRWREKNVLLLALRDALEQRVLQVWFQPIVDGRTGTIKAIEALLRWKHEGQWISPARFIPLAEDHGLINPIGRFVLEESCAALARLRQRVPHLTCNVNVSVHQIIETDLVSIVLGCIADSGLPPSAIHLELTETALAQNEEMMAPVMRRLLDSGVHFHLDDFGTGYSSLQRLNRLPINTLKLDRAFVRDLGQGKDTIARVIYMLAHELSLDLVAEGVENETERDALLQLGYTLMQGYLFARPMPEDELRARL